MAIMMKNMKKSMKVNVMISLSLNNGMENATEKIMESRLSKLVLNYTGSVRLPNPLLRGNESRTLIITSQVEAKRNFKLNEKFKI